MVATASASNATKVTASTRPTVSGRRAGAHIPPVGSAGVAGALAASVLTRARVEPQLRLTSSMSARLRHVRGGGRRKLGAAASLTGRLREGFPPADAVSLTLAPRDLRHTIDHARQLHYLRGHKQDPARPNESGTRPPRSPPSFAPPGWGGGGRSRAAGARLGSGRPHPAAQGSHSRQANVAVPAPATPVAFRVPQHRQRPGPIAAANTQADLPRLGRVAHQSSGSPSFRSSSAKSTRVSAAAGPGMDAGFQGP
jgi:hypothetical protein